MDRTDQAPCRGSGPSAPGPVGSLQVASRAAWGVLGWRASSGLGAGLGRLHPSRGGSVAAGIGGPGEEEGDEEQLVDDSDGEDDEAVARQRVRRLEEREELGERVEDLGPGGKSQILDGRLPGMGCSMTVYSHYIHEQGSAQAPTLYHAHCRSSPY